MLQIENASVSIQNTAILHRVSLSMPAGSVAGLIGRNGAGKTTLMRTIMGFLRVREGTIRFDGNELSGAVPHRRVRMGIGYMPEDRRLVPSMTVEENILLPQLATQNAELSGRLSWVYEMMPEVAEFSGRRALQLSGGQQKLVALARALFCGTRLLLLDEPFEGVAPALAQRLAEVIGELKARGQSVLLSESDHVHSAELLDQLYVVERGEVHERSSGATKRAAGREDALC